MNRKIMTLLLIILFALIALTLWVFRGQFFKINVESSTEAAYFNDFNAAGARFDHGDAVKFSARVTGLQKAETVNFYFWSDCSENSSDLNITRSKCGPEDKELQFNYDGAKVQSFDYNFERAGDYSPKGLFERSVGNNIKHLELKIIPTVSLLAGNYFDQFVDVEYGGSFDLFWEAKGLRDGDTCESSWAGKKTPSGSEKQNNITKSGDIYSIECGSGEFSAKDQIEVRLLPKIVLKARPESSSSFNQLGDKISIPMDSKAVLSWSAMGVNAGEAVCVGKLGDEAWAESNRTAIGTYTTSALTSSKTFNLVCAGPGGNTTASYKIAVESGNCILKGGNQIEALTFCRNSVKTVDGADNIEVKGSVATEKFNFAEGGSNLRFFYNYPSENELPPGFRYLSPPKVGETN